MSTEGACVHTLRPPGSRGGPAGPTRAAPVRASHGPAVFSPHARSPADSPGLRKGKGVSKGRLLSLSPAGVGRGSTAGFPPHCPWPAFPSYIKKVMLAKCFYDCVSCKCYSLHNCKGQKSLPHGRASQALGSLPPGWWCPESLTSSSSSSRWLTSRRFSFLICSMLISSLTLAPSSICTCPAKSSSSSSCRNNSVLVHLSLVALCVLAFLPAEGRKSWEDGELKGWTVLQLRRIRVTEDARDGNNWRRLMHGKLWNSLPASVFPSSLDLNSLKREVSRHLSHSVYLST
ncbi:hypothetical protein E2C01_018463 [Portunus trituberculatus]|uniref:Uncharacterized protein n=1 Tax=Portunus trituberculatus TaxID=210409 RepID=A0A5B7DVP1_PORTR|nr:hypothetical protein [Portunus trituberculatus]